MKLHLLQAESLEYFGSGFNTDPRSVVVFLAAVTGIIILFAIVRQITKKYPGIAVGKGTSSGGGSGFHPLVSIATHSALKNMGLNRDQIRMMDFVFRQDNVTNPQHSLKSTALLDRHFRRAYRVIEKSASTDDEAQQRLSLLFSSRNIIDSQAGEVPSSTRQIHENADAILGFNRDRFPVKVVSSKGENLVTETPKSTIGSNIKIPRGSKVNISFFTKSSKGFSFESRIIGVSESAGQPVLHLVHSNKMQNLSKRRFRRRQVTVPTQFFFVNLVDAGRNKQKRMVVDKRRLTGSIMDISIGGCSIKTNVLVPSGTRLKIEATYGGNNIAVLGQVLRTNRTGIKSTLHISFLKVPRRTLNTINAMVYEYIDD